MQFWPVKCEGRLPRAPGKHFVALKTDTQDVPASLGLWRFWSWDEMLTRAAAILVCEGRQRGKLTPHLPTDVLRVLADFCT